MSTLRVDNVTDLGDDPVVTAGVVDSAAITSVPASALPAGSILQVVSTTKTDTFSSSQTSGSSTAVTGLAVTHSLSNASNKAYITVNIGAAANNLGNAQVSFAVYDGSSFLYIADAASSRPRVSAAGEITAISRGKISHSFSFLHSPGTTSSITYTVYIFNTRGVTQTLYVNRDHADENNNNGPRAASSITLMEVAG